MSPRLGFFSVGFAYLAVMALSAAPSPLYPIYQRVDGFSTFTITLVYAAFAFGVLTSLFLAGHLSDWHGRRRLLVPAVAAAAVSSAIFLIWPQLPALFAARFINGLATGVVAATATVWLAELHRDAGRAQLAASSINIGGLGLGPLLAGILAQWVGQPLRVPYAILLGLLLIALLLIAITPETRERPNPRPPYRPQRASVPPAGRSAYLGAAGAAFLSFSVPGMFSALARPLVAGHPPP